MDHHLLKTPASFYKKLGHVLFGRNIGTALFSSNEMLACFCCANYALDSLCYVWNVLHLEHVI